MTIQDIPAQLAREFRQLGQRRPGDNAQPVATFTARPWEAFTLIAALQAASRHPGLSDMQREIVLGFAHQVGDQLVAMARALVGPESAIETTTAMGFDPQFDVDREGRPVNDNVIEIADEDELEEPPFDDDEEEPDSHVIGERRCRYVEPAVIRLSEREGEMELEKCCCCARFFLQDMPIRMFQDLGDRIVLGLVVCEKCAPKVLRQMHSEGGPT